VPAIAASAAPSGKAAAARGASRPQRLANTMAASRSTGSARSRPRAASSAAASRTAPMPSIAAPRAPPA